MKILILHASAGAGHRRAAEALEKAFGDLQPEAEVVVSDLLDYTPAVFRETYAKGYLRVVRRVPELWGYMYGHADRKANVPWRKKVRSAFNQINTRTFLSFFKNFDPDAVVCTHFMPLELLSTRARKGRTDVPLFCVVTDFAVHGLWIVEEVAGYFVSTDEASRHLVRLGQPADRVSVTGIPVDPVFAEQTPSSEAREKLGLEPALPTVLIMSGGFGIGPMIEIMEAFKSSNFACQLIAVAGGNEKLEQQAKQVAETLEQPVRVYGRVDNVHELMDAADLVITKPGGLSSSESLAKAKPMLIVEPIPGQEQRNCEYLLEMGAAARLYEPADAAQKVEAVLSDRERLDRLQAAARTVGRPHAVRSIAEQIMAYASRNSPGNSDSSA
jgi:processive 1,2-diacylglycerol beta-glucosyltransferase